MGRTLSVIASGDATSPEGRGSGEDGRYRPHQLTGIKQKLHALAKGSPLERLPPAGGRCRRQATKRGTAGERSEPERVRTESDPLRQRLLALPPPPKVEALAKRASFVLIRQLSLIHI